MEPESQIHTYNVLKLDEMQFMYAPGAKARSPKIQNFLPEFLTLHHLLHATLALRIGDATTCTQYERNLMQFYMEKHPFSVFDYILEEIFSISRTALHSCGYAQQIMMMIEKVSKIYFLKDHEMMDLKLQFLNETEISMDVSSPFVVPRSFCSGSAPPPLACSSSSSSSVLRVLKSMFDWCHDTRQCQDVLLSNQKCQNEKMGIDKFDEFPLPMPPLDDDPFASLSIMDLVAMEAADDDDDDTNGSGNEYEEE
jgi:hypothetical protein